MNLDRYIPHGRVHDAERTQRKFVNAWLKHSRAKPPGNAVRSSLEVLREKDHFTLMGRAIYLSTQGFFGSTFVERSFVGRALHRKSLQVEEVIGRIVLGYEDLS